MSDAPETDPRVDLASARGRQASSIAISQPQRLESQLQSTWKHMRFREGREWKGGVRFAYRVLPPLSFTFFALGPGSEIRGGILSQPPEKK